VTFSIVAFDPAARSWGVAVASKFLACGALVPWGRAGAGAIATQARANLGYGPDGLALLSQGFSASDVVDRLTSLDDEREHRQVGVVDARGRAVSFTGAECLEWAGGLTGEGYAAQGNILAGPDVVDAMVEEYLRATGSLASRLVAALRAGNHAGGDRRGKQSAGLRVWRAGAGYGGQLDVEIDLRVDDHVAPATELARLLGLHGLYFGKPDPTTLLSLEGGVAHEVAVCLEALGFTGALAPALESWASMENFEERLVEGSIDPLVLEELKRKAAGPESLAQPPEGR
jgi:uncharacterized Ntn-hydrolase superfamily protein